MNATLSPNNERVETGSLWTAKNRFHLEVESSEASPSSTTSRAARTSVECVRPGTGDVPELARICFAAFGQLHNRHGVQRDFPDVEGARKLIGLFVSRPDILGVAARLDGRLVGSSFLTVMDEVGGVGPITVSPSFQGRGIGRGLMEQVLNLATERGTRQVRLVQEALNTTSLPLYTSLGFDVRETLGCLTIAPAPAADSTIRLATHDDLPVLDRLSRRYYRVGRLNELAAWMTVGFPVFIRECHGETRGYFAPGKLGHLVAETEEDALALIGEAGRHVPPEAATFLCPLRNADFHRGSLRAGHRLIRVLTYMTLGPYQPPRGVWAPSYLY